MHVKDFRFQQILEQHKFRCKKKNFVFFSKNLVGKWMKNFEWSTILCWIPYNFDTTVWVWFGVINFIMVSFFCTNCAATIRCEKNARFDFSVLGINHRNQLWITCIFEAISPFGTIFRNIVLRVDEHRFDRLFRHNNTDSGNLW